MSEGAMQSNSPDQSQQTSGPGSNFKFDFGSHRDVIWGIALGLSFAMNMVAFVSWRLSATESQVKDYDLTFFMGHEWANYKAQQDSDHLLIQTYILKQAVEETDNGGRRSDHHSTGDAKGAH